MREIKCFPDKKIINTPPGFADEWSRLTSKIRKMYSVDQLKEMKLVPHREKKTGKVKPEEGKPC